MTDYLYWLADLFEEAQVPLDPEHLDYLDQALHRIAGLPWPQEDRTRVVQVLRERFLQLGPPGRQLLAGLIRDEAYARRDSPLRPHEGTSWWANQGYPSGDIP